MAIGAVAFLLYAFLTRRLLTRHGWHALTASVAALPLWFAVSFALCFVLLKLRL